MDDLFAVLLVGFVMFIFGMLTGFNISEAAVDNTCEKYGKNISANWVMTCEKAK